MTTDGSTTPDPLHLAEARAAKSRGRTHLQAIIDEHLIDNLILQDDSLESSLFADMPWKDPSPSGEFEAINA